MERKMEKKLIIFDLDGTLIDSKHDLAESLNQTLLMLDIPPLPLETIFSSVGNGVSNLLKEALGPARQDEFARGVEFFLDYYEAHLLDTTVLYPGVREALDKERGCYQFSLLTNKPLYLTEKIVQGLGLSELFPISVGGDTYETKKPHPLGALSILERAGVGREDAMLVGDSANDVLTGNNSGIFVTGVAYGLGSGDFEVHPPDHEVDSFPEIFHILRPS